MRPAWGLVPNLALHSTRTGGCYVWRDCKMKTKWSVLAVYENGDARQLAVQFCDSLVQRFWSEFGFDLGWCDWSELEQPVSARDSGKRAQEADLIVVAPSRGTIPSSVKSWLELALKQRGDREGVLVGLAGPEGEICASAGGPQAYLRKLAHDAGMDFLTTVPECLPAKVPESADAYTQRATQVTSLLDSILRYTPLPPPAP
jgi:hypothetical protein